MLGSGPRRTPSEACARCGAEAYATVWGHPLCTECWGAWLRDSRFAAGEVQLAIGQTDRPEDFTASRWARYEAEATRRTAAWVQEGRARR